MMLFLSLMLSPVIYMPAVSLIIAIMLFSVGYKLSLNLKNAVAYALSLITPSLVIYALLSSLGAIAILLSVVALGSLISFYGAFPVEFMRYGSIGVLKAVKIYSVESSRILGKPLLISLLLSLWGILLIFSPYVTMVPFIVLSLLLAHVTVRRGLALLNSDIYLFKGGGSVGAS
ncbi:MAG: hypothetical protein QXJ48_05960 [Candidatus Korarchaeum sp.]